MSNAHIFALYLAPGSYKKTDERVYITAPELIMRVRKVLRLRAPSTLILFSDTFWYRLVLEDARELVGVIEHEAPIVPLRPEVTFLLPILEKSALEHAVYALTVFGAREIQLVMSVKSRKDIPVRERERLHKIALAAAEQAKQYCLPKISDPIDLTTAVQSLPVRALKLFGDSAGSNIVEELQAHAALRDTQLVLNVGPEGGFTDEELILLGDNNFKPVSLGSSILRACDATGALLAVIRAYMG